MSSLIIGALGLLASAFYVGYLAYAIGAIPLWVIVIGTFILAIADFAADIKAANGRNGGSDGGGA